MSGGFLCREGEGGVLQGMKCCVDHHTFPSGVMKETRGIQGLVMVPRSPQRNGHADASNQS